ncbi:MAG TPA: hypothetical protein VFT62_00190 [Mycobacteriales bacterium]|nr:hypothetical protein [Mycobacteriales bacterium]
MSRDRDFSDQPDNRLEGLLRDALREEAETVVPAGDGLSRIQHTVQERRARRRWLQPVLAVTSAVVLVLAGFGAYAFVGHDRGNDKVVLGHQSDSPNPEPTSAAPSPSEAPVSDVHFPKLAIFPFTSATEERNWEKEYAAGSTPWAADPKTVALMWVDNILGQPSVDKVTGQQIAGHRAVIGLGRVVGGESAQPVDVTSVSLQKFGNAWIVVGADDPTSNLTLSSPQPHEAVSSPLTVTGPGFGVDESLQVDVRDAESPTSYGSGRTGFGNGTTQWQVDVPFTTPSKAVGTVVAVLTSNADGGPQRITAQQVRFTSTAQPGGGTPAYFYAVKDNRITQFASRDGSAIRYLTDAQPGGPVSDPQVSATGDRIYYVQGVGTCADRLMAVFINAPHGPYQVTTADTGYRIAGFAATNKPDTTSGNPHDVTALFETACDGRLSPQAKLVTTDADGNRHVINYPSMPPKINGNPSFEPGQTVPWVPRYLDAYVQTGMSGYLARYDLANPDGPTPATHACPGFDGNNGEPQAIENDASGQLWVAIQTGSSMDVVRCRPNAPVHAFTIPGNDQPADVDVTSDGSAVLLTDVDGKVWRWDGSGSAVELHPSVPLTQVTW